MALWDLRAKAVGWPLYRLLGGRSRAIPAYAGGISLGYQPPAELAQEARGLVAKGYRAIKLRVGDTWRADVAKLACAAGADLINDTWAGAEPGLPAVAAEFGAGLVCSHTGGAAPRTRPFRVNYGNTTRGVVDAVLADVTAAAEHAVADGHVLRHRLAGHPGRVDRRRSDDDAPVGGDPFAGTYQETLADQQYSDRHDLLRAVPDHSDRARRQPTQGREDAAG